MTYQAYKYTNLWSADSPEGKITLSIAETWDTGEILSDASGVTLRVRRDTRPGEYTEVDLSVRLDGLDAPSVHDEWEFYRDGKASTGKFPNYCATNLACDHGPKVRIPIENGAWEVALCRASSTSPACYPEFRDTSNNGLPSPFVLGSQYGGSAEPGPFLWDITLSDIPGWQDEHGQELRLRMPH